MVDIKGDATAWALVSVYWDSPTNKIGEVYANGAGEWTLENVIIPEALAGNHLILANDGDGVVSFTIPVLSSVTVSAQKALPGDSLDVTGSGFGDELPVGIYLGTITAVGTEVVADDDLDEGPVVKGTVVLTVDVTVEGDISGTAVTGPAVLTVTDDGEGNLMGYLAAVVVDDGGVITGLVDVTIDGAINYGTGAIAITASGVDGSGAGTVTDIDVTIDAIDAAYSWAEYDVTPVSGITTTDAGSFDSAIVIPAIPVVDYGNYVLTAMDTDGNTATPSPLNYLSVDYYLLVTPTKGPAGITVTLSGRIPASTAYELRLDSTTIATGTSAADTTYSATHEISSFLSLGTHTFYVVWGGTETKSANFDVTESPRMTLSASAGMAGTVITISSVPGYPFSTGADLTLYLNGEIVNSTAMDDRFGPTNAFSGLFTDIEFVVPTIAPGVYSIVLMDEYGASTGTMYTFTVTPTPETAFSMVGTTFYPGNTLSWSFESTDSITVNPTVTVRDPTGAVWWTGVWTPSTVGTLTTIPYQNQIFGASAVHATLPSNAPLGSWNWTAVYSTGSVANVKATGLFSVMAAATLDTVTADIADLVDEISDISGDVATIKTDVSNVEDLVEALDIDIPDFSALTDGIADLQVSVDALDAVVTAVAGDVATVDTKVGTLEGTITSIEGDIATIETDVGTLQADISDVKANVDNTPAWIAVVLALVAAVAAIFAVITIRQKIAG
jgi:hypothetical protein